MAMKDEKNQAQEQSVPVVKKDVAAEFPLSLEEYCARLSTTDRRAELIGGFHFSEKQSGRVKDTETNYKKRFAEFCKQPA